MKQIETVLKFEFPLIIMGDFNYILSKSNKQGGRSFQVNRDMREFGIFIR